MSTEMVPLNPVTEEDMSKVKEVFTSMVDNVLAATRLQSQVQDLVTQVDALAKQVERLRSQNDWLDEQMTTTRKQRDDAISEAHVAKEAMQKAEQERDYQKARAEANTATVEALQAQLEQAHKDHDDAEMRAMEHEDNLAKANAKLAKLHEVLGIAPTPKAEATPTPSPQQVVITQSFDPPPVQTAGEPAPSAEPERSSDSTAGYRW